MTGKKPSLGRGLAELSPLMARNAPLTSPNTMPPRRLVIESRTLPLDLLQRGKYQPRLDMRPETLNELAQSIKAQGVMQPIVVRPLPVAIRANRSATRSSPASGAGAPRRWRGSREIPAIIREVPDEAAVAMALIENIQREDLNPLEEARALSRLIEEFGLTHQSAAEAVGRSRAAVSNLLRLMELADEVKQLLEQRSIEMGHARALLSLTSRRQQIEVAGLVAKKALSVRDTEALVQAAHEPAAAAECRAEPAAGSRHPPAGARAGGQARCPRYVSTHGVRQGKAGRDLQQPR